MAVILFLCLCLISQTYLIVFVLVFICLGYLYINVILRVMIECDEVPQKHRGQILSWITMCAYLYVCLCMCLIRRDVTLWLLLSKPSPQPLPLCTPPPLPNTHTAHNSPHYPNSALPFSLTPLEYNSSSHTLSNDEYLREQWSHSPAAACDVYDYHDDFDLSELSASNQQDLIDTVLSSDLIQYCLFDRKLNFNISALPIEWQSALRQTDATKSISSAPNIPACTDTVAAHIPHQQKSSWNKYERCNLNPCELIYSVIKPCLFRCASIATSNPSSFFSSVVCCKEYEWDIPLVYANYSSKLPSTSRLRYTCMKDRTCSPQFVNMPQHICPLAFLAQLRPTSKQPTSYTSIINIVADHPVPVKMCTANNVMNSNFPHRVSSKQNLRSSHNIHLHPNWHIQETHRS